MIIDLKTEKRVMEANPEDGATVLCFWKIRF